MFASTIPAVLVILASLVGAAPDLDSSQQRLLRDAVAYLDEAEKEVMTMAESIGAMRQASAPPTENETRKVLNQVNWTGTKIENAFNRFAQLPANDTDVANAMQRGQGIAQALLAVEEAATQLDADRAAATDPANFPNLDADREQLEGFSLMIAVPSLMQSHPLRAAAVIEDLPKFETRRGEIEQAYAPILGQHLGRPMQEVINGFDYRLNSWRDAQTRYQSTAPVEIRAAIEQAKSMSATAVERRDARVFSSGVPLQLERAEQRLAVLAAMNATDHDALRAEYDAAVKAIDDARTNLRADIIEANVAPRALYAGSDAKAIEDEVTARWTKMYGDDEILGLRIPMREWERRTGWAWALDEFQKYDESELQVGVVVKTSSDMCTVYFVHLVKDHLKGDSIRYVLETKDDERELPLHRFVPMANWDG